jgi:hypothetical protein
MSEGLGLIPNDIPSMIVLLSPYVGLLFISKVPKHYFVNIIYVSARNVNGYRVYTVNL